MRQSPFEVFEEDKEVWFDSVLRSFFLCLSLIFWYPD